jgi:hypothetical protein
LQAEDPPRWLVKLAGGVLSWFGIGAAAFFAWACYKAFSLPGPVHIAVFALIGASALLAVFCITVGWRLFMNRPNRHGSALGPLSWRILGSLFGLAGLAMLGFAVLGRDMPADITSIAVFSGGGTLFFAYWCFMLAARR